MDKNDNNPFFYFFLSKIPNNSITGHIESDLAENQVKNENCR